MRKTITYAITVCDEWWQLHRLLKKLQPFLQKGDQVLIQGDETKLTDSVVKVVDAFTKQYAGSGYEITFYSIPLDGDFGKFKNFLASRAHGDWIFQLDADEYPTESLLTTLLYVITQNEDTEVILVPRINTVIGITQEDVDKWGWNVQVMQHSLLLKSEDRKKVLNYDFLDSHNCIVDSDDQSISYYEPVINFPDYQWRLYQNKESIKWINKVHEVLTGFTTYSELPADITWSLVHEKDVNRQRSQNKFYEQISDR